MFFNGTNGIGGMSLLSFRYKVVEKLFVDKRDGYYVFKCIDLLYRRNDNEDGGDENCPTITTIPLIPIFKEERGGEENDNNKVIVFLQILRKVETNLRSSLPSYCEYHKVDEREDFIYRGISDYFYYICVLKYSEKLLKFI